MVFEVFIDADERFRWQLRNHRGHVIALAADSHAGLDEALRSLAEVRDSSRAEIRSPQA